MILQKLLKVAQINGGQKDFKSFPIGRLSCL